MSPSADAARIRDRRPDAYRDGPAVMMRRLHPTMAAARLRRHVEQFAVMGRSERENADGTRRNRDDRGSVAVLMCFIVLIGAALVGALVYAGANLEAASRADTYASEAARAASIAVGPVPASDGQASLQAAAAASRYLQQAGAAGSATVTGPATVRVTVTVTVESVFGTPVSATRTHTAQLQVGVTSGEGVS